MGVAIRSGSYQRIPSAGQLAAQQQAANNTCRGRAVRAARSSLPLLLACLISSVATYGVIYGLQQRAAAAHMAEDRLDGLTALGPVRQLPGGAAHAVTHRIRSPEALQVAAAARLLEKEIQAARQEQMQLGGKPLAVGAEARAAAAAKQQQQQQQQAQRPAVVPQPHPEQPAHSQPAAAAAAALPLPATQPHPGGTPAAAQQHIAIAAAAAKTQQQKHAAAAAAAAPAAAATHQPATPHTVTHSKDPGSRSPGQAHSRSAPAPHAPQPLPRAQRREGAALPPFGGSGRMTVALVNHAPYHLEIVAGWLHILKSMPVEVVWYQAGQFTPDGNFTAEELLEAQGFHELVRSDHYRLVAASAAPVRVDFAVFVSPEYYEKETKVRAVRGSGSEGVGWGWGCGVTIIPSTHKPTPNHHPRHSTPPTHTQRLPPPAPHTPKGVP